MPIDEGSGTGGYIPPGRLDRRDRGREDERDLEHPGPRLNRRDRGFRDRPQDPKEVRYPLPISGPGADIVDDIGDLEDELEELKAAVYCSLDKVAAGTIISPSAVFTSRPQIPLLRAEGDLIITRIHIKGPGTSVLAGDLKYADDLTSFAGATLIQVCDTTAGAFTITSGITDDSVPKGKYIYFQMDSAPAADWTDFYIEVYYT